MRPSSADSAEANGDVGIGWYLAALVMYIGIGFLTQSVVLNWIVGPLFPLIALYLGPRLVRRARSWIGWAS